MVVNKVPDAVIQELRNILSLNCREILMQGKGKKKDKQALTMEKIFHGSAGYASVLKHMIEGKGIYASMFEKSDLDINREGNELRKNGANLELKPIFHLNESTYCAGLLFTRLMLDVGRIGVRAAVI